MGNYISPLNTKTESKLTNPYMAATSTLITKKRPSDCTCGAQGALFHTLLRYMDDKYTTHYYCKKCGNTWDP